MRKTSYLLIVTLLPLLFGGCSSVHEFAYFQPADSISANTQRVFYPNFPQSKNGPTAPVPYEATIQSGDVLSIYVSSLSPEASSFFNAVNQNAKTVGDNFSVQPDVGYTVDSDGMIDMPLIGKVKLGGLTTKVAHDTLVSQLEKYLQSPTVRLYLANYKITVLGEVLHPGVYTINNEKVSLPQALGMAGDMTIYGNRMNVLLIREEKGQKTFNKINLTKRDVFFSDLYYLHSNDIIYVEPVKGRVSSVDNFWRIAPLTISSLTLLGVILFRIF